MDKKCSYDVSESKLVYNKKDKKLFSYIIISIATVLIYVVILSVISYGFFTLFELTSGCSVETKISYCSAIVTFAGAVITISSLMVDRQFRIYDDSLNIFNQLNSKKLREQAEQDIQRESNQETLLHRWYFIKKFKTYNLKNKKKLFSRISDANITFYFDNGPDNQAATNSLVLNIPLTSAEWQFFKVLKNCLSMLYYQKSCLFEFYSENDKMGLLMWETVLSLYKSVMVNKIMNAIRLINILCIPTVIIIACLV